MSASENLEKEDEEQAKIITTITENADSIINNKKLNAVFGQTIGDIISKHTLDALVNCKSEEEATSLTMVAMLEIYITLTKSVYNLERIIIDRYNISRFAIDPLKIEAILLTEKALSKAIDIENKEKKRKEAAEKDVVGSLMYT